VIDELVKRFVTVFLAMLSMVVIAAVIVICAIAALAWLLDVRLEWVW
jgi:hypothetical protein